MTVENRDAACVPTSRRRAEAERSLVRAVLRDGIQCFLGEVGGPPAERTRLAAEASAWITNRNDAEAFSFENVCAWLDLPAKRLREFLLAQVASQAPSTPIFGRTSIRYARIRPPRVTGGKARDIAGRLEPGHLSSELECEEVGVGYGIEGLDGPGAAPAAACG